MKRLIFLRPREIISWIKDGQLVGNLVIKKKTIAIRSEQIVV